jgi:hypothetical protein
MVKRAQRRWRIGYWERGRGYSRDDLAGKRGCEVTVRKAEAVVRRAKSGKSVAAMKDQPWKKTISDEKRSNQRALQLNPSCKR